MYQFPDEMRKTYEAMSIPFMFVDMEGDMAVPILVSDGFCKFHEMKREELMADFDNTLLSRLHPDEFEYLHEVSQDFLSKKKEYDIIFRSKFADGYHHVHATGTWQTMPDGKELAFFTYFNMKKHEGQSDETPDHRLFQKDSFYTDPLTGLPNLNYLHKNAPEKFEAIRSKGKIPALVYFDVDSMQSYNSRYGIRKGDELLLLFSNLLQYYFIGSMILRAADDHFIMISPLDAPKAEAENGLEPARKKFANKLVKLNKEFIASAYGNITGFHAGICIAENDMSVAEALDHAKQAEKVLGLDLSICHRFFSNEDNDQFHSERYIVENIHQALEEGWIKVYYQGILRIETGKAFGFEALARWHDPNRGILSPAMFIPALEKYSLLYEMDLYVFKNVCEQVKMRFEAGLPLLPVSVNFCGKDFDLIDMAAELNKIVDSYHIERFGIDKSYFIIEITEQDMATATESFNRQLRDLRRSGFQLWIDDFGSGYSSLNVFSRFDIDLVKFDMDFLRNIDEPKGANREILNAIVAVARRLGVHTLCEGMETEKQKRFLMSIGCELGQGFLFHKPESLDPIFERLNTGGGHLPCETPEERARFAVFME